VYRAERRDQVIDLRVAGLTYRAIAQKLNVSLAVVHGDFDRAVRERPTEGIEQLRATADEILRAVLEGHVERARAGDDKSAHVVIKAVATHAKIFGYEAPQKVEMTGKDGGPIETRAAQDELLSRIARIADATRAGSGNPEPQSN
jgi:hypothetical protein